MTAEEMRTEQKGRGGLKNRKVLVIALIALAVVVFAGSKILFVSSSVDPNKIRLYLVDADRHEYRDATAESPEKEIFTNMLIKMKKENEKGDGLKFGIMNESDTALKKAKIIISFPESIRVKEHSQWKAESQRKYSSALKSIGSNKLAPLGQFVLGFEKTGVFGIDYKITSKNTGVIERSLFVSVSE